MRRPSVGLVLGWVLGMIAVALIYQRWHDADLAHGRAICRAHHQVFTGVTAPRRHVRATQVRCFAAQLPSAAIATYSLHHSDLVDTFDVLVLLLVFGLCVVGGWRAGVATRRIIRSGR